MTEAGILEKLAHGVVIIRGKEGRIVININCPSFSIASSLLFVLHCILSGIIIVSTYLVSSFLEVIIIRRTGAALL